jgi:hypothetical protein
MVWCVRGRTKTDGEVYVQDLRIVSNCGRYEVLGNMHDSVIDDGNSIGNFELRIEHKYFGDEDLFDLDLVTATFTLSDITLDTNALRDAHQQFRSRSLSELYKTFDFGIKNQVGLRIAISPHTLEPSNTEKAILTLTVGGKPAALHQTVGATAEPLYSVSFPIDPTSLADFYTP